MKILVICQYYYPEPFRLPDICQSLVKRGHDVTVVTGIPNYPMGKIYKGYRWGKKRNEVIGGVKVHRCFTIGRRSGAFFRLLNYYSYAISSSIYTFFLKEDFDVVFVNQLSPVMMAKAGITYKKRHRKKMVLFTLDLWPESLVAGGIAKDSFIFRFFRRSSEKIYRQADQILVSSQSFTSYFKEQFDIDQTDFFPQYAENHFSPESCEKKAGKGKTVDLMFAGNLGAVQDVDTVIFAAEKTRDIPHLRWHIVGDGSEYRRLKELAKKLNLSSVIFHGRHPVEEMPKFYQMADAMLITMTADPFLSRTLPGKVQSYMAAGKAILGAVNGETARVVAEAKCGFCAPAQDPDALATLVRNYVEHFSEMSVLGKQAYSYYQKNFSKEVVLDKLEQSLRDHIS